MRCIKALALRSSLREILDLPKEEALVNSGKECAMLVLSKLSPSMKVKINVLWWKAWHLNNVIFGEGKCGIKASTEFLERY
jgi:hypothetical protein